MVWCLDLWMSDPYDMPTCITCGDVTMFCSCIEKEYDKTMKKYRDGKKCPDCLDINQLLLLNMVFQVKKWGKYTNE